MRAAAVGRLRRGKAPMPFFSVQSAMPSVAMGKQKRRMRLFRRLTPILRRHFMVLVVRRGKAGKRVSMRAKRRKRLANIASRQMLPCSTISIGCSLL